MAYTTENLEHYLWFFGDNLRNKIFKVGNKSGNVEKKDIFFIFYDFGLMRALAYFFVYEVIQNRPRTVTCIAMC